LQEEAVVRFKIEMIRTNHPTKEVKKILQAGRLYMAEGVLRAIRMCLVRAIQLAACCPYDSNDTLRSDEDPNYIRWNSFPLNKLEGFSHPLWVAQDMAANRKMVVPGAIRNKVERVHLKGHLFG
jgi:hypothetical protein